MRNFVEKRTTTNGSVYRKVAIISQLGCPLCSPNKGCNRRRKWDGSISWKDTSKAKKQWQRHHMC